MLQITIPELELWDEGQNRFVTRKAATLHMEHSLVSISKWESKWNKAFLGKEEKTDEEVLDYIKCMTITQNVDPDTYNYLTRSNIEEINAYIAAPMTATTFAKEKNSRTSREIVTSEVIYHWMIALNIPVEFQKWHLNRLLTLIRVCNIKNQPPKKKGRRETASSYAALNAARRKQYNSKG